MSPIDSRARALPPSTPSPMGLDLVPFAAPRDETAMLDLLDALLTAKRTKARKAAQLLDVLRVLAHQQEEQLRALQAHVAYRKKLHGAAIVRSRRRDCSDFQLVPPERRLQAPEPAQVAGASSLTDRALTSQARSKTIGADRSSWSAATRTLSQSADPPARWPCRIVLLL